MFSGGQNGTTSSTGSTQMQAWVQGAIAKISSSGDAVSNSTPNPITGPSSFMPISINTGTFPGTPAVRLIGDCHFLHRLCQLLLFCFFFRRTQRGGAQRSADASMQKPQSVAPAKVEESNSVSSKPAPTMVRSDEGQAARGSQLVPGAKGVEDGPAGRLRLGCGNAGQGYTFEEVENGMSFHYFYHTKTYLPRIIVFLSGYLFRCFELRKFVVHINSRNICLVLFKLSIKQLISLPFLKLHLLLFFAGEGPFPHTHGSLSANISFGTPIASFSSRKQQHPGAAALY